MVEQGAHVVGHRGGVVGGGLVELARMAMAAVVERDDAAPGAGQRANPARADPVHLLGRGETVHQHDRLGVRAIAFVEIGDLDRAIMERRHDEPFIKSAVQ